MELFAEDTSFRRRKIRFKNDSFFFELVADVLFVVLVLVVVVAVSPRIIASVSSALSSSVVRSQENDSSPQSGSIASASSSVRKHTIRGMSFGALFMVVAFLGLFCFWLFAFVSFVGFCSFYGICEGGRNRKKSFSF